MRRRVHLRAAAKVNLRLEVLGRRPDGYHLLRTWMYPVSLWDELTLERTEGGVELLCDHPEVPREDLTVRAAKGFLEAFGLQGGVRITLKKGIPVGAGLGGGSSDAAAVLKGLAVLYSVQAPLEHLHRLARGLGADVPFFLQGGAAIMGGVGEELVRPLPRLRVWLLLVFPGVGLSTEEVYRRCKAGLTSPSGGDNLFTDLPPRCWDEFLFNALEGPARSLLPSIQELKGRLLQEGAEGASMTGSGPTMFGVFEREEVARAACERLKREESWEVFLVRPL